MKAIKQEIKKHANWWFKESDIQIVLKYMYA